MVESISAGPASTAMASSPVPMQPVAKAPEPTASVKAAPALTSTPKAPASDSVEISVSAQVKSLQKQGDTVQEIALHLGMDPARVAVYLGEKQ